MRTNQCWIIWPSDVPKQFSFRSFKKYQVDKYEKTLVRVIFPNFEKYNVNKTYNDFFHKLSELDLTPTFRHSWLKKELESRHLPHLDLLTFDGNSTKWPEFTEKFKTRVLNKVSFTNSMRMERLLSVLKE